MADKDSFSPLDPQRRRRERSQRLGFLAGAMTPRLEILLGGGAGVPEAPLLCAAELGFSPLGSGHGIPAVVDFVHATRDRRDGLFVGLVEHRQEGILRRFLLIQGDRSSDGAANFYMRHNPDASRAWRDFYYAAVYSLICEADVRWRAPAIVIAHPTGYGWPAGLRGVRIRSPRSRVRYASSRREADLRAGWSRGRTPLPRGDGNPQWRTGPSRCAEPRVPAHRTRRAGFPGHRGTRGTDRSSGRSLGAERTVHRDRIVRSGCLLQARVVASSSTAGAGSG